MEGYNKNIFDNDTKQLPLVSICSITYNHAPFIRQCLDGFLMQKTNFKYEVIIHDDASTDGTTEIIKEYAKKYPDLITPIYQTENQYSKGLRGFFAKFVFPKAKGKYIALCEGDDYWTDPYKLQKQVDFMEKETNYSMIFHPVKEEIENSVSDRISSGEMLKLEVRDYLGHEIIKSWAVPTCSVLIKKDSLLSSKYFNRIQSKKYIFGDIILFLSLAEIGKIKCFTLEPLAVYRRHISGVTFQIRGQWQKQITHLEHLKKDFNGKYKDECNFSLCWMYFDYFTEEYAKGNYNCIKYLIKSFLCNYQNAKKLFKRLVFSKIRRLLQ